MSVNQSSKVVRLRMKLQNGHTAKVELMSEYELPLPHLFEYIKPHLILCAAGCGVNL